jgi:hypothetical protein
MSPSPIIRPTARDFEPQLFGRSLSPDAIGELLGACRTWKNKRIKYLYYID